MNRIQCLIIVLMLALVAAPGTLVRGEPPPDTSDIDRLSLKVAAMMTLHDLDLTADQLKALKVLAKDTADPRTPRDPAKASAKYIETLKALHDALGKANNDEKVTELADKRDALDEDEDVSIDDEITLTPASRTKAATFLRTLSAPQVTSYLATYSDEGPDPEQDVVDALTDIREANADEVEDMIKETAESVGTLIGGLDLEKSKDLRNTIAELLRTARKLPASEFTSRLPMMEKSVKLLVAADPMVVIQHWLERDIAELLSNPQLSDAIDSTRPQ